MKYILVLVFFITSLFAVEGREIFDKECSSCHKYKVKKYDFAKEKHSLKAPPMNEISRRIKTRIKIYHEDIHRFAVVSFIKEYIKHPSLDYYMCDDKAIARFDIMPAITNLKPDEYQIIAEWVYDEYSVEEYDKSLTKK